MPRRYTNTDPTPENFRNLWDTIHDLRTQLTAAQTTITQHATTLTSLGTSLTATQAATNAATLAAKTAQKTAQTAQAAATTPPPGTPPPGTPPPPNDQPPPPGSGPPATGKILTTDMLNLSQVTIESSPPVNTWTITTTITNFSFVPTSLYATFGKQSGAGRWPDYTPPGWTGPIQYTLWLFLNIGNQWYGAGAILFWFGETGLVNVAPSGIGTSPTWWLYSSTSWGPMAGYQPQPGESVGFMVSAGFGRLVTDVTTVAERSQVIVIPFPSDSGGVWSTT